MEDKKIIWAPQEGSQQLFLSCPVYEVLYEGTRGSQKTDALLMDFAQHVGKGYGRAWRGIIFRRSYKQLTDLIDRTKKWYKQIFPNATLNETAYRWRWPDGEELMLSYMDSPDDYWNYHGWELPFVGWEELTNWPTQDCYDSMKACCRSSDEGLPRKYRATCNPWGCVPFGNVLTVNRGLVPIQGVSVGDWVWSVTKYGDLVTREVLDTIAYKFEGRMVKYDSNGKYMEFTSDHRLPVSNGNGFELMHFDDCEDGLIPLYGGSEIHKGVAETREVSDEMVYCLTIEDTETFFIEQNGFTWLSGNSGHSWVKKYFISPAPPGKIITNSSGQQRVRIHGSVYENKILLKNDPDYVKNLEGIQDENKKKAWLYGSWDITSGGAIDDIWDYNTHVIEPFYVPSSFIVDRSFDWGSSKPFSVGWWAESDGSRVILKDGSIKHYPPGTLFRIYEWYGWEGEGKDNVGCRMLATDVAKRILEIEASDKFRAIVGPGKVVRPGPADSSIYDAENGVCIGNDMAKVGVRWTRADKRPGSRVNGLERFRKYLSGSKPSLDANGRPLPLEEPGMFIFNHCRHFIRTVPVLPRDEKNPDDVDTNAEDHCFDSETEILTDAGWKLFKDLNKKESVATLTKDGRLQFQKPYKYIERQHVGTMLRCEGDISFCVTDEHRFPILNVRKDAWELVSASELPCVFYIPTNMRLETYESVMIKRDDIFSEEYNGLVYCVCVENETIYVRKNGTAYWSGNCYDEAKYRVMAKRIEGGVTKVSGV